MAERGSARALIGPQAIVARSHLASRCLWMLALASFAYVDWRTIRSPDAFGDLGVYLAAARDYLHGVDPYSQRHLGFTDFIYPPSSLPMLAPLGLLSIRTAEVVFMVATTLAAVAAVPVALAAAGLNWRSWLTPAVILVVSILEPVRNAIWIGQVNTVVLLLEVLALLAACRNRWSWSGAILGISFALKPVLLPLIILPLLLRRSRAVAVCVVVMAGLLLVGAATTTHWYRYFTVALPEQNLRVDAFWSLNGSLASLVRYLHIPELPVTILRVLVAAVAGWLIWIRLRTGERTPVTTIEVAILIVTTTLLCAPVTYTPYAQFVIVPALPLLVTPASVLRSWVAWVGIYCVGSPDIRLLEHVSPVAANLRWTLGLMLILSAFLLPVLKQFRIRDSALNGAV